MDRFNMDEIERMVRDFRITELQLFLAHCNKQRSGKKQELYERSMTIVRRNPTLNIINKIKELHSQRINQSKPSLIQKSDPPITSFKSNDSASIFDMGIHENKTSTADLSFVVLPFYDHVSLVTPPTVLKVKHTSNRFQEENINFQLTPQQTLAINNSRTLGSDGELVSNVQVQLRFASADKVGPDIEDMYPPCILVKLNGKTVQLPNIIPTNKPNADPKRPPRPLDLTWSCRNSPCVNNLLNITWALPNEPDLPKTYCFTITLVNKRSSDDLTEKVLKRTYRKAIETENLIKAKLSDSEDDIALTSLKVSLLCPLAKMKMKLPCIARTCDHIQCFDVQSYLMMNEKKPTWRCPVCDQRASYQDLIIDELFVNICKVARDCDEILFAPDGTWAPLITSKENQAINPHSQNGTQQSPARPARPVKLEKEPLPEKEKAPVDIIVLSDSEDDSDNCSSIIQPVRSNKRPISAISSDSSLQGSTSSSQIQSPLLSSTNQNLYGAPSLSKVPSLLDMQVSSSVPPGNPFAARNSQPSMYGRSLTSTQPLPPYPIFMPNNFLDFSSVPSLFTTSTTSYSYPNYSSQVMRGAMLVPDSPQIPEANFIDFANRYESPLLDDSDIIPLD